VPPFPGSISKIFSPKSAFARHGELFPFLAYKNSEPVGRIAAVVNHSHNKYYNDKVGFFGFFDCIDDAEVAHLLMAKAREVLVQKGLTSIRGPYSPSSNEECGLLVEGFESAPFVMMPYNPPYYLPLYEKMGLRPIRDLYAFYLSAETEAPERIRKIVDRVRRSTGISIRSINMQKLEDELAIIHKLYNVTLDRNWGFVPIELEDLISTADELKQIADPNMVLIAEKNGEPVGFSLTLPNMNELMWKTRNSGTLMRVLKFLWYLKTSHPKEARLIVLGVAPEFRNTGIAALFYYETLARGKSKYVGGELSWVEANNTEITKGITVMGGKKYKSYRIFESPLTGEARA